MEQASGNNRQQFDAQSVQMSTKQDRLKSVRIINFLIGDVRNSWHEVAQFDDERGAERCWPRERGAER